MQPPERDSHDRPGNGEASDGESVTRAAAAGLVAVFRRMLARGVPRDAAQRFALNSLTALLAPDRNLASPPLSDSNGALLVPEEKAILLRVSRMDWSRVRPDILGTLFEQSLARRERHATGAHFTSVADIMKVVGPTIVAPWTSAITSARSIARLNELRARLSQFRVLDPSCGTGNFLSIAFRELQRLERLIWRRAGQLSSHWQDEQYTPTSAVSARQLFGIDINPLALELAKIALSFASRATSEYRPDGTSGLSRVQLEDNFLCADALLDEHGARTVWPAADVIIGNPPFLGAKRLKPERGTEYVARLRRAYPDVPGMADYCVYWIRRAHDHLPQLTDKNPWRGRAGLVGTQNIRNNQSRIAGLDHVIANGGTIVDAVDNQPWSGDAQVHVSIANWVKTSDPELLPGYRTLWSTRTSDSAGPFYRVVGGKKRGRLKARELTKELIAREVAHINSALSNDIDVSTRVSLACNKRPKRCFQGKIPGYSGFLLDRQQKDRLWSSRAVIFPYLTGRELLGDFCIRRFCIDFANLDMLSARKYRSAFEHCREHVLPAVEEKLAEVERNGSDMVTARREHRQCWWQFWNRRDELTRTLTEMRRYIGCSRVTRRPIMAFIASEIVPSDLVQVFAFDDDYSFGVLQSTYHFEWFRTSSRLKIEKDLRYSIRSVFETFPWPQTPTRAQVVSVAAAARQLRTRRQQALQGTSGGLRGLYRTLEEPGRNSLRDAHAHLDEQVRQAYGFATGRSALACLLALNRDVAAALTRGQSVQAPGIPTGVESTTDLRSADCLRP